MPKEVDLSDLMTSSAAPAAAPGKGAPPAVDLSDLAGPPPKPSLGQDVRDSFADIPREIGHQFMEATRAQQQTIRDAEAKQQRLMRGEHHLSDLLPDLTGPKMLMNAMSQVGAPLSGTAISALGRPVQTATGGRLNKEAVGNAALMAVPFAQELAESREATGLARTLGVSEKTAREALQARKEAMARTRAEAKSNKYTRDKDMLVNQGVHLTPGMSVGGSPAGEVFHRMENAGASMPLVGTAIREAQAETRQSWNRAMYNKVTEPIGHVFGDKDMPLDSVGREGLGAVERKISAIYEGVKPHLQFQVDDAFRNEDRALRKRVNMLPEPQRSYVKRLFTDGLDPAIKTGKLNGQQYKDLESFLGDEMRAAYGGGTYERRAGHIIEDALAAIQQNAERHTDPKYVKALKNANEAWAKYVRVRGASANRPIADEFTPGDMLRSIKREDRTRSKGAFAKGDALLQREAQAAQRVIPDKLPYGGAERLEWLGTGALGGGIGYHFGPVGSVVGTALGMASPFVTNPMARAAMKAFPITSSEAAATMSAQRPSVMSLIDPATGVSAQSSDNNQ